MSGERIAWFCTYTPLEILDAAGLEPYGFRDDAGDAREDVLLGDAACSFARSCLGGKLDGTFDFLAGAVIAHSCECMRRLYDGWVHGRDKANGEWVYLLDVPKKYDSRSVALFASNLGRFQEAVSARFRAFTDHDLREAIERRNRLRRLLEEISRLRKLDPPGIRGSEAMRLLSIAFTEPLDVALRNLEEALVRPRESDADGGAPRVLVYGGPLNATLHGYVESAGGEVVFENACNGWRFMGGLVSLEKEPLRALAEAYLGKLPCPRMLGTLGRRGLEELCSLVEDYRVDGVIYCAMKFCANLQGLWPLFRDLATWGIPVKMVEGEITGYADRREIEAFVKRMKKGKEARDEKRQNGR